MKIKTKNELEMQSRCHGNIGNAIGPTAVVDM
jgi:hypothetical protein